MCFCGEGGIGVIGYDLLAESGAFKIVFVELEEV